MTKVTEPIDIAVIRARRSAITETWSAWSDAQEQVDDDGNPLPPRVPQGSYLGRTLISLGDTYEGSSEDCAFVAAAPADIDALLAEVARLRLLFDVVGDVDLPPTDGFWGRACARLLMRLKVAEAALAARGQETDRQEESTHES